MNNFFNFFIFSLINDFLYDPFDRNNSWHFYAPFYNLLNHIRDFNSFVVNRTAVYNHVDINTISKLIVNHSKNSSVYTYINACIRFYSPNLIQESFQKDFQIELKFSLFFSIENVNIFYFNDFRNKFNNLTNAT